MYKVVYIDCNSVNKKYPNTLNDGDRFFTHGFGGLYAREFKKYNIKIEVECWKTDSRIKKVYEKNISGVNFKIFPSFHIKKIGDYSPKLLKYLKNELKRKNKIIFNISSIRHLLFYTAAFRLKNNPLVVQHHGEASAIYKTKVNKGIKKLFYFLQIPFERIAFKNIDLFYILDKRIISYLPSGNKKNNYKMSNNWC